MKTQRSIKTNSSEARKQAGRDGKWKERGKARNPENDIVSAPRVKSSSTGVCGRRVWADPKTCTRLDIHKYIQHIVVCCWMCACVFKIFCSTMYRAIAPSEDELGHTAHSPNMDTLNQLVTNRNVVANTLHEKRNDQRNTRTRRPMLIIAVFLITWTDGHTGKRIGEADIPGHGGRGPKDVIKEPYQSKSRRSIYSSDPIT